MADILRVQSTMTSHRRISEIAPKLGYGVGEMQAEASWVNADSIKPEVLNEIKAPAIRK